MLVSYERNVILQTLYQLVLLKSSFKFVIGFFFPYNQAKLLYLLNDKQITSLI